MTNARDTQQGFTLIEVLIALTLMALVSLISWRGLEAVQRSGERLDERAEETLSLIRVLSQIERDILLHAGTDILSWPAPRSGVAAPSDSPMPSGIAWDAGTGLSFVRAAGDGRWQELRWYLKEGSLFRAAGAPSHLLPLPRAETSVAVLEHVRALTIKVWQPDQGWIDPLHHKPVKSGSAAGSGLVGLEIALYREGPAGDKPYRKVVLLP